MRLFRLAIGSQQVVGPCYVLIWLRRCHLIYLGPAFADVTQARRRHEVLLHVGVGSANAVKVDFHLFPREHGPGLYIHGVERLVSLGAILH